MRWFSSDPIPTRFHSAPSYWLRTVITRSTLENGVSLVGRTRSLFTPPERDGGEDPVHVDTWPKRGINQEGNQIKFGKQLHKALPSVAMSPTKALSLHSIKEWWFLFEREYNSSHQLRGDYKRARSPEDALKTRLDDLGATSGDQTVSWSAHAGSVWLERCFYFGIFAS